MANQKQMKRLRAGVSGWNTWRKQHSQDIVDLSGVDLSGALLSGANLGGADLRSDANLSYANLNTANLSYANLNTANLNTANLSYANLSGAIMAWTSFGDRDLRSVKGLETIQHGGPSNLSINTIYQSEGDIPEIFAGQVAQQVRWDAFWLSGETDATVCRLWRFRW